MRARPFVRVAVAVAAYIPAAWAAGLLSIPPQTVVTFRPPNALLLGLGLLDSPHRWWIYALATVPANRTMYVQPSAWLAIAGFLLANALEVGVAAALVRRLLGRAPRFNSVGDCTAFIVSTATACAASATLGSAIRGAIDTTQSLPTN